MTKERLHVLGCQKVREIAFQWNHTGEPLFAVRATTACDPEPMRSEHNTSFVYDACQFIMHATRSSKLTEKKEVRAYLSTRRGCFLDDSGGKRLLSVYEIRLQWDFEA